jgi:beta-glucosidase
VPENADVAIVCTATVSSEGFDRMNLNLPFYEDDLIQAVAAAQNKTVVVVSAPGAVLTPWAKARVLCFFFLGLAVCWGASALASVFPCLGCAAPLVTQMRDSPEPFR